MMYCTLLALFLNPIPLISGTVQSEMPDIPDRAGEITIDELLIFAESGNGVYSNGYWEVPLNFTLAQGIMNVNITVNVTHDAVFEANTTERGNLTAGAYNTSLEGLNCTGVFNFTDEGLYSVNASVEGWLNGTGMVAGYKQLTDLNFSTITVYLVNISLQGLQKGGVYGARVPVNVSCYVNYTGNGFADETNVSLSIVNVSSG